MKKLKAFTLIELIVVMAILGILMVSIMRMMEPVSAMSVNSKVIADAENVERSIASYIVENTRYATNIGVYKGQASASAAISTFLGNNPKKKDGTAFTDAEVNVICVNNKGNFTLTGKAATSSDKTFRGRLISKVTGKTGCGESQPFDYTGDSNSYMVFGDAYYGSADYFIRIENFTKSGFDVVVESDYYYSNSKTKKYSRNMSATGDNYSNYTVMSCSLVNTPFTYNNGTDTITPVVDTDLPDNYKSKGIRTTPENFYIVYTIEK
ncbi:MAG: type II secretion system GspH family protein [Oscillospiraceae bacterium]|nr:type II secretion system GspH family protein [Oscillospiraceae bacterium]